MNKKLIYFFLGAITLFIFSSCEDVIQVKLDQGGKLIVIDAFVDDTRKTQLIRVINNSQYFSNTAAEGIPNAQVILTDLTTNAAYTFTYAGNGDYIYNIGATDTIAKPNHKYELSVTINGVRYTALSTQKRAALVALPPQLPFPPLPFPLGVQDTLIEAVTSGPGSPSPAYYTTILYALDIADNVPDYYRIKTFRNDTLFKASDDINVCIDGTGGEVFNSELPANYFTPPATFLGFKRYKKGDICRAEIHSISKEAYNFFVQAQAQINNGGLFATTPENVRTNIISPKDATKAVGWFNMASVATSTLVMGQ
jgi:hypothetical protein